MPKSHLLQLGGAREAQTSSRALVARSQLFFNYSFMSVGQRCLLSCSTSTGGPSSLTSHASLASAVGETGGQYPACLWDPRTQKGTTIITNRALPTTLIFSYRCAKTSSRLVRGAIRSFFAAKNELLLAGPGAWARWHCPHQGPNEGECALFQRRAPL